MAFAIKGAVRCWVSHVALVHYGSKRACVPKLTVVSFLSRSQSRSSKVICAECACSPGPGVRLWYTPSASSSQALTLSSK